MIDEASLEFPPVAWQYPGQIGSAEGTGALSHTAILPTQAQVNLFYYPPPLTNVKSSRFMGLGAKQRL